jgi:hypothetical protein
MSTPRRAPYSLALTAVLVLMLVSERVYAADLRGRIWPASGQQNLPADTRLIVKCPGIADKSTSLADNGSYSIRGLPSSTTCELTLQIDDLLSRVVTVRTSAVVVRFSAEVRRSDKTIIMLPR